MIFKNGKQKTLKSLLLVNDISEEINNFTDDDISERYILALIVIMDLHNEHVAEKMNEEITIEEAHIGVSNMKNEMDRDGTSIEITRNTEPESKTRH